VESSDAPVALLFTTDEEAGTARCATAFVDRKLPFEVVVVSEPTACKAVLAHRGVATGALTFHGRSGHSSMGGSSANHALVRWAALALAHAETQESIRLNVGRIEGGEKPNMIAARAEARFGVRPPPGVDPRAVLEEVAALAEKGTDFRLAFLGASFVARGTAQKLATSWGLEAGDPVDFWTEAAIFSEAGYPALVYGPGRIAEAHAPDEYVDLAMLAEARESYARILSTGVAH
jgi:acetylornithine deacetylase